MQNGSNNLRQCTGLLSTFDVWRFIYISRGFSLHSAVVSHKQKHSEAASPYHCIGLRPVVIASRDGVFEDILRAKEVLALASKITVIWPQGPLALASALKMLPSNPSHSVICNPDILNHGIGSVNVKWQK